MSEGLAGERTDPPPQLYCGNCGVVIPEGKHFCPQCLAPASKGVQRPAGVEPAAEFLDEPAAVEGGASVDSAFEALPSVGPQAVVAAEEPTPTGAVAPLPDWLARLPEETAGPPAEVEPPEVPVSGSSGPSPVDVRAPAAAPPEPPSPIKAEVAAGPRSAVVRPVPRQAKEATPARKLGRWPAGEARPTRRPTPSLRWVWLLIAITAAVQSLVLFCSLQLFAIGGEPQDFWNGLCCCLGPEILIAALGVCALAIYRRRK